MLYRFVIVASEYNSVIMDRLIEGAKRALKDQAHVSVIRVPGSFEIPLVAKTAALSKKYDGIVALGCVVRGETPHFEYISSSVSQRSATASRSKREFRSVSVSSPSIRYSRQWNDPANRATRVPKQRDSPGDDRCPARDLIGNELRKWDLDEKPENTRYRCCFSGTSPTTRSNRLRRIFAESNEESPTVVDFARQLVNGTIDHVEKIDDLIGRHAENWRLDRMAVVDRNILRLATYEFLYDAETAKTIVINEAIEIARRFSAQESPQFINGILDSIRKEVESMGAQ